MGERVSGRPGGQSSWAGERVGKGKADRRSIFRFVVRCVRVKRISVHNHNDYFTNYSLSFHAGVRTVLILVLASSFHVISVLFAVVFISIHFRSRQFSAASFMTCQLMSAHVSSFKPWHIISVHFSS
jgi:hypothetical protein